MLPDIPIIIIENISRRRRATPDPLKNTCKMLVVADHRFFKNMGRGEESTTINYLVSVIICCQLADKVCPIILLHLRFGKVE